MARVYVIGTGDTKAAELVYAKACVEQAGVSAVLVDVGTTASMAGADVPALEVASHHPDGPSAIFEAGDRGVAVSAMTTALIAFMATRPDVDGVLGLGGSGNTAIVTAAMRSLPIGVPKLMLSTVAAGNTAPYVGPTDIAMMYPVVDIAGLNRISRKVIGNAAHAVAGMVLHPVAEAAGDKPAVAMTMFGVTTACISHIRAALEPDVECFVFHATGTGGQSMEKLVESGLVGSAIDITTTEVADFLVGGVFPCTADRFGAFIRSGRPYVGSVGALDMVNFGARETVPARFEGRTFHIHNAQVTLMRTTPDENARFGAFIVESLNRMEGPVRFLLPLRGVSAIDAPGQPFHDPAADAALFEAIRTGFRPTANRRLIEVDAGINDEAFALAAVSAYREIAPSPDA